MLRKQTSKLPPWILSILTVALILWLTLAPDPLGDDSPRLFPGADKVAHAIMFGFLTVVRLLDRQRRQEWKRLDRPIVWTAAAFSTLLGIAIEFIQLSMGMGRGFEVADMVADAVGSAICALLWLWWQRHWSLP